MDLEILDFELVTCVDEVMDLLATQAHSKGLEIAALIYPNVPTQLQGDAGRLRQILTNLVGNAIKFTTQGEVVVRTELQSETPTQATILFSVTDTGIGITPEEQAKLFKPFSQVDASTTRKYGGTGLGLAVCKQLVTLMHGEIGVESRPNEGSRFWFAIPLKKHSHPLRAEQRPFSLPGQRLLVVDDNATNRKVVRYQASQWGIQVDEADGAAAALKALQDALDSGTPYDLALIDMQMPEVDGITLGKQIKTNSIWATLPLIMLTSNNQRGEVQRALNVGFAAYLIKPVKPSRLLDTIMTLLGTEPGPASGLVSSRRAEVETSDSANSLPLSSQHKLKILIAEDNFVNQKVALKQLKNLGYEADVVANGAEVLQLLETISYDLIFMDCQMPVLDGYEATREIRSRYTGAVLSTANNQSLSTDERHRQPIVIAMTANAMKEDRAKCLAAGMDDYLSKPVCREELQAMLIRWGNKLAKQEEEFPQL
jgi:hypothetical protein